MPDGLASRCRNARAFEGRFRVANIQRILRQPCRGVVPAWRQHMRRHIRYLACPRAGVLHPVRPRRTRRHPGRPRSVHAAAVHANTGPAADRRAEIPSPLARGNAADRRVDRRRVSEHRGRGGVLAAGLPLREWPPVGVPAKLACARALRRLPDRRRRHDRGTSRHPITGITTGACWRVSADWAKRGLGGDGRLDL